MGLTLFVNGLIKPFTMYSIALFFLGTLFRGFIGPDAMDYVKMPLGLDLPVGAVYGDGVVALVDGVKMLEGSALAELSRRLHPAGRRSLHGHGPGLGLPGAR